MTTKYFDSNIEFRITSAKKIEIEKRDNLRQMRLKYTLLYLGLRITSNDDKLYHSEVRNLRLQEGT